MEEELTVDPKYKQAFNNGYLLAKHEPELFKQIEPNLDKDSPLLTGKKQYEIDRAKDYFKQFDRGQDKGKDRTKDKGIDR